MHGEPKASRRSRQFIFFTFVFPFQTQLECRDVERDVDAEFAPTEHARNIFYRTSARRGMALEAFLVIIR
jgi:hypothetical protein